MREAELLRLKALFGFVMIGDCWGACYDYGGGNALEGRSIGNIGTADGGEGQRGVGVKGS